MFEIPICPDSSTGETRSLFYDEHGYEIRVGTRVQASSRLEAVCYLVGRADREHIALVHGLQDAGEHRMAEWIARNRQALSYP